MAAQRVAIGVVTRAFGTRGELRVRWLGDGPQALASADRIFVARSPEDPVPRRHAVRAVEPCGGDEVRMALAGLRDTADAEAYVGHLVLVDAQALPALGDDEFYWHELVGYRVETTDGELVGVVRTLWETGAHDVLVVDPPARSPSEDGRVAAAADRGADDGGEDAPLLIPTAREVLVAIDRERRTAVVDAPPGLLER